MNSGRLPAVRLDSLSEDDPASHDLEELPSASRSKFGFAWPDSHNVQSRSDNSQQHDHITDTPVSVSVEDEADSNPTFDFSQEETPAPVPSNSSHGSSNHSEAPSVPRLSRAFSMPLPSQLSHWQHPSRSSYGSGTTPGVTVLEDYPTATDQHFQELALELADSVQMAVQTLLQLSPPHLFDPAKEQLSACSVQMPTPSVSALLTSMKNLNYISANMRALGSPHREDSPGPRDASGQESLAKDEFDIGEVLQSVGDSLGGVAAEAEVDMVLHHGDAIKHLGVRGDECGVSYALSHVVHQVLVTTRPGDGMEIGLSISGQPKDGGGYLSAPSSSGSSNAESPPLDSDGIVVCTFDIVHKFAVPAAGAAFSDGSYGELQPIDAGSARSCDLEARPEPQFDTTILRRLLRFIGGRLRTSLSPGPSSNGRRCELSVTLERGPSLSDIHRRTPSEEDDTHRHQSVDVQLGCEPSIDELTSFAETLRGKKVAFHANSRGSFAHHLTRYLTAWGMDISHVPTDGVEEKDPAQDTPFTLPSGQSAQVLSSGMGLGTSGGENVLPLIDSASDTASERGDGGLSLIIIDDDVHVLRRRLLQYRAEAIPSLHLRPRKRPSLAAHHRPRSTPTIRNALYGNQQQSTSFSPVPIVHFTSLAKYKLVKDVVQAVLIPGSMPILPEVIVIPKPAGPRRILTALHTATHKPIVDPFFSPIATSPMSPSGSTAPFLTGRKPSSQTPPTGSAERAARSGSESGTTIPPSSPLARPEGLEYFSDAAMKKLGGNAASGLVIQSPDGRPAGIFFHPQSRSSFKSDSSADRERTATRPASQRSNRRGSGGTPSIDGQTGISEASHSNTPRRGSLLVKPSPNMPTRRPSLSPTTARPEPPSFGDQTDLHRSYKGKGRMGATTIEQEKARVLSTTAWREATQNLARIPLTPLTPVETDSTSVIPTSETQSPPIDPIALPPRNLVNPTPASRSPPAPSTSPEPKKSVARRATQGPKSPVPSTNNKKSKAFGSNIVPPISVLIVEDNAINQTILSTFMRRNKIKYDVAWNGREAVEKWKSGNFHLILMDIQMPVMDGIEATKEIRRLEKAEFPPSPGESSRHSVDTPNSQGSSTSSTPFRSQVIIVALTASSLQSDRVAALAAGCNDFLTKPVTNSWLNDKIIEWGSIKALQMWAELRPEMAKNLSHDQAIQARSIANKLYVPPGSARDSPTGSPLRGIHLPLAPAGSRIARETDEVGRPAIKTRPSRIKATRRPSDKDSSESDSSPERWPISSDDEVVQDPITEPPAVIQTPIQTPIRPTIELPCLPEPTEVTGQDALLHFLEDSKQDSSVSHRPTLLGQRAISSVTSSTSIASVLHDTPGVGGTMTDGLIVADMSREQYPPEIPAESDDLSDH